MPSLATIETSFEKNGSLLCLKAPGMSTLKLPTSATEYESLPVVKVTSSGATAGGPWLLATINCVKHEEGSKWINKYLNSTKKGTATASSTDPINKRLVNGKTVTGSFALVRSMHDVVHLGDYPPIFPIIERTKWRSDYKERFEGNYRRLSDFAPFLLVSQASARALAGYCNAKEYSPLSFRGNLIVDGTDLEPWAEESWYKLKVGDLVLHTIKACPRCTVPCRDQTTGEFLFEDKLKLWKVLKAAFPRKFNDPEWGSWAGAYMGVYMGHNAVEGCTIKVGDSVVPIQERSWDSHLKREFRTKLCLVIPFLIAVLGALYKTLL